MEGLPPEGDREQRMFLRVVESTTLHAIALLLGQFSAFSVVGLPPHGV